MRPLLTLLTLLALAGLANGVHTGMRMQMNPIRKVVTLLQVMQKKVEAEGEREEELYEKFMCYCKTGTKDLDASIEAGEEKISELTASIKESEESLAGTKEKLEEEKANRAKAEKTIAQTTAIREKEQSEFAATKSEYEANIDAIGRATVAIEKGMEGNFLQTGYARLLKKLVPSLADFPEVDRHTVTTFLSEGSSGEYAPASGQITGILKQMGDEMKAGLEDAQASESNAIKDYNALMSAKKKEVKSLTKSIEAKLKQIGELGVSVAEMKNDLGDTEEALTQDKKFLKDLLKNCATKTGEFEEHKKLRAQELLALADTIKMLNSDDALELFKKTLPGSAASFLQLTSTSFDMRQSAAAFLKNAAGDLAPARRVRLDLLVVALRGKKIGFEKVIGMIDELIGTLKKEQQDDDSKKDYCEEQFDLSDDKKKNLERSVADTKADIADTKESLAQTKNDIAALTADIANLDKKVMEATKQRQDENSEYKSLMSNNAAAKTLLGLAKKRLNKFYNPKLALAQSARHGKNQDAAPPPPPPAAAAEYGKQQESGVIQMINLLITDLEKEIAEATAEEKDAQTDYEAMMTDSAKKRAEDSKTLTDKMNAKADMEEAMQDLTSSLDSFSNELEATKKYIVELHAECDWLLQYFDVRKEARASEIDALGKAKAVLSGADYSFLQRGRRTRLAIHGHLRGLNDNMA